MSDVETLKKERSSKKCGLTQRIRHLKRYIAEGEYSTVVTKSAELKSAFLEFEAVCQTLLPLITVAAEKVQCVTYFEGAEDEYVKSMQEARHFVTSQQGSPQVSSPTPTPAGSQQAGSQSPSASSAGLYVKLPALPKPDVFSGSPLQFPLWKASFDALIGNHERIGFDQKMYFLKMYTSGEAKSAIEALFLVPNEDSYTSAFTILTERFGSSRLVTAAFRRKVEEWPKVGDKDSKGLQRFADFLEQVKVARLSYPDLSVLDDQFENQKLVAKLPAWLASKWIEKVVRDGDSFPKFKDFVTFIKDKAKVANHLLWGDRSAKSGAHSGSSSSGAHSGSSSNASSGSSPSKSNSLSTSAPEPKACPPTEARSIQCVLCKSDHRLQKCPQFSAMALAQRKQCIMDNRLCFACLLSGHQSKDCKSRHVCGVCKKRHPTLLHKYEPESPAGISPVPEQRHQNLLSTSTSRCSHDDSSGLSNKDGSTTMVVPVVVSHGSKETVALALLDTQSNTHFVTDAVLEKLGVSGQPTKLQLSTMHGTKNLDTKAVEGLHVKGLSDKSECIPMSRCFSRISIPFNRSNVPTAESVKQWPHLSQVIIPDEVKELEVGLLIGFTCSPAFRPLQFATGKENQPWGVETKLGWCVVGPRTASTGPDDLGALSHVIQGKFAYRASAKEIFVAPEVSSADESMSELTSDDKYSADDVKFLDIMSNGFWQRPDGYYSAPLPLKCDVNLPNNRGSALKRLESLKNKFDRDPGYRTKYTAVMDETFQKGFAEPVPEGQPPQGKVWYIPHHGVPKGDDQVRVVCDCAAKFMGVCLNDVLLQGPNLLNEMLGIVLRFRTDKVGLVCDVEKMYYQFKVDAVCRDLMRFLWWPGGDTALSPVEYRMTVHIFGAVSSSGVATYGLRRIALDHGHKFPPAVTEFVLRDFYVDDGETARHSADEARDLLISTQELLKEGGCRAHKVLSNSSELMASIPSADRVPESADHIHKVLGISWNTEADELYVLLSARKGQVTRRVILSSVASIFDPLGLAAPLVLQARLILQELCRVCDNWDASVPPDIQGRFDDWAARLGDLKQIHVPRCQLPDFDVARVEFHHFADASNIAYAACSYVRFVGTSGEYHVSLLLGKCKVVPIKPLYTIPRLELMACVLAVRLAAVCRRELPWQADEYFWTDSTVVLGYVKNVSAKYKIFVANRVQVIHSVSRPDQWFHVTSAENPADDGSRGVQSSRWLNGPEFLSRELDVSELEVPVGDCVPSEELCLGAVGHDEVCFRVFHDWFSSKKVVAWVLRFVHNCRPSSDKRTGGLSLLELDAAERCMLRQVQKECFPEELDSLRAGSRVPRGSSLRRLDVFLDAEGLLRVGGRVRHGPLEFSLKHPVVLPGGHEVYMAIIEYFHRLVHHQGRGMTSGEVRNRGFWIAGLNRQVKKVIHSCVVCRRLRAKPCEQKMGDLPPDRVTPVPPFSQVAADCFGPFVTKNGRKETKRWALTITCLYCRAVHIEMLYSMSSDSFINAFRRFVSLRGPVQLLRCDHGTNFEGAVDVLLRMGCEVAFNPPDSSHRGGVVERMNGCARRVLEGVLVEHGVQLDDEALMTALAECAAVINSRPLNVISVDDPLGLEPLTPNHLITMKPKVVMTLPLSEPGRADLYSIKRWKRVQYLCELFWSRWRKEILHTLQARSKWSDTRRNMKVDDIVLIVDDQVHRSHWRLARVAEVTTSKDGLVRSATLMLPNRSKLVRPIQKLVFLLES